MWREEKAKNQKPELLPSVCTLDTVIRNSELVLMWFPFTGRDGKRATTAAAPGGQPKSPGIPTPASQERAGGRTVPPQAGGHGPTAAQWS